MCGIRVCHRFCQGPADSFAVADKTNTHRLVATCRHITVTFRSEGISRVERHKLTSIIGVSIFASLFPQPSQTMCCSQSALRNPKQLQGRTEPDTIFGPPW